MAKAKLSRYADECRRMLTGGKATQVYSAAYTGDQGHKARHPAQVGRGARQGGQRGDQDASVKQSKA
jgi:hypothetical protein